MLQKKRDYIKRLINQLKTSDLILGRLFEFVYQTLRNFFFVIEKEIRLFKNRIKYGKLHFKNVYWINTNEIQYFSELKSKKARDYYRVLGGNWDGPNRKVENSMRNLAFKQKFLEGKKWEDTEFYRLNLEVILKGLDKSIWKNKKKAQFDKRLKSIEKLYYTIKTYGIKPKHELKLKNKIISRINIHEKLDNIAIDIGRNGQLLIRHGKNRLGIVKTLNISKIPVTIVARHKEWMEFRRDLKNLFKIYHEREKYQIFNHPDLQNLPFNYEGNIFKIVKNNMSVFIGKLLELEANLGYFSIRFEEEGFQCYIQESNPKNLKLLQKLKIVEDKKFIIIPETFGDYSEKYSLVFDVVIAINFFESYIKKKRTFEDVIKVFKNLRAKELFIKIPNPKNIKYNNKVFEDYNVDQILNKIIENSSFDKVVLLNRNNHKYFLYKFLSTSFLH